MKAYRTVQAGSLMLALAYGGSAWMVLLRAAQGAGNQPPLALMWLRDGSLALPLTLLAVWVAGRLAGRASGVTLGVFAATAGAVALAISNPAHVGLFGVSESNSLPVLANVGRDVALALVATLPLVAATLGVLAAIGRARARARVRRPAAPTARWRRPVARMAAAALAAGTMGLMPFATAPASAAVANPGAPCPAGANQRSFDVTAIDVKIPLNRFGDNDPKGKMFVATSTTYNGLRSENLLTAPGGTLEPALQAVREEEASQKVSIGLRDDPIQPLSIRANEGDCVTVNFTNSASGGRYGLHIDGLMFATASSGDAIGRNADSSVNGGETTTYRYYVPNDRNLEGSHYIHPGPGFRSQVDHGLFGMLNVEPPGSTYLDASFTGQPLISGWEAIVAPAGKASFREAVLMHHEVGNDNEDIFDKTGLKIPQVDALTGSYRPGEFAVDYRAEPFRNRLLAFGQEKSHSYSSYTFGDPATPMPRGYIGDPTKFRISHASGEKFHIFHLHGGGDRWRLNPVADPSWNYADTRLNKHPQNEVASNRLDSQSIGPGESYNLELEGGAGGVQHTVGDLLFHCHISKHYLSGMWGIWRIFNTRQPDFAPLPDRVAPASPVTSDQLMGKTFDNGQSIDSQAKLDSWVRQQVPPQGVTASAQDPSVWDWKFDNSAGGNPARALGEPEDNSAWADASDVSGHSGLLPGDQIDKVVGGRPAILFNPVDGRPSYPLLRMHLGKRPPFSPKGHSGSPFLGEWGSAAPHVDVTHPVDPYAHRPDGLCPSKQADGTNDTPVKHFNIVAVPMVIQRSIRPAAAGDGGGGGTGGKGATDPEGKLFVLAQNKAALLAGTLPTDPLALRVNVGDCAKVTLTSELPDVGAFDGHSKTSIHIHHIQFDVQGSDGVSTGFAYEHSVRPYAAEDPTLTSPAGAGDTVLHLSNVDKFQTRTADGANSQPFIGTGMGTEGIEVRQVVSVDPGASTVTLDAPLSNDHASGEFSGFEFIQYEWYADTEVDNLFWHDHVDGIHGWGHGLVGQLIVEPAGSTYTSPTTGEPLASGTIADIHVDPTAANFQPLLPGHVNGSFRELALWTINDNDKADYATLNLKAAPFSDRPDAANRFSSYKYGDPTTPLLRAYPGDPIVVRTISVSPSLDTLRFAGQRFAIDGRMTTDAGGNVQGDPGQGSPPTVGTLQDTVHYGISERYTIALEGNGPQGRSKPGDYLYFNGDAEKTRLGAWGIVRVLDGGEPGFMALPGNAPAQLESPRPSTMPAVSNPSNPCPSAAPIHRFAVSAVEAAGGARSVFVPSIAAAGVQSGQIKPEPLVLHVAEGECVKVSLTNTRTAPTSFAVNKLDRNADSSGVNVGYSPDNNTAPGATRDYIYYADTRFVGTATIADMAGEDTQKRGLYGALVVAPKGATFSNPTTAARVDVGAQVDVHVPAVGGQPRQDYRDFSLLLADNDPAMSQDFMPYPTNAVAGATNINYANAPAGDGPSTFKTGNNDPATPVLRAYAGDPVIVHEVVAPGSEQGHVFSLGGPVASRDMFVPKSEYTSNQALGPGESFDAKIVGGAGGGGASSVGDYFYGDLRRPFTQIGVWGLQRVLPVPANCAAVGSGNPVCLANLADLPPPTVPAAPRIGTAVAGLTTDAVTSATATWIGGPAGGSAVTGYLVTADRYHGAILVSSSVWPSILPPSTRSLKWTGLAPAATYRFRVRAVNAVGTGPYSRASNLVQAR